MNVIESIIHKLGYHQSDHLFYLYKIEDCRDLSWHEKRVLLELAPVAVYVTDSKPLVLFFHHLTFHTNSDLYKKIWNAQIPVIISDEGSFVMIYTGENIEIGGNRQVRLQNIAKCELDCCDENNDFSYWNVTDSLTLEKYRKRLKKNSLNDSLISNIRSITQRLKNQYHISFSNKLLLQVMFIRYLIDRRVSIGYPGLGSDVKHSQEVFLDILRHKDQFLSLLRYLKEKFNGNLFEMSEEIETAELTEEALAELYDFMAANEDMASGQYYLFRYYDFNIIPVEVISNIYEILLGQERKGKDSAFYTPECLADYIVEQTVGNDLMTEKECKVLDPACGSGIFLVKTLQKILECNADSDGFIRDQRKLCNLLKDNIYGVDCNEEAIDVTIFSLYMTLLDYCDPKDLNGFTLPLLKGDNLLCCDFFDKQGCISLEKINFRFILGNPPWGSIKGQKRYQNYCKNKKNTLPDNNICAAFLLKAYEIGQEDTECSLVIPSKLLYNSKDTFKSYSKDFLKNIELIQILELSSVRKDLFKGAETPATVLSFLCHEASKEHKFEYISIKPNKYLKSIGIIMIEPGNVKYISQMLVLQNDGIWKTLVYGTYWDFELTEQLQHGFKTIKDVIEENNLIMKRGLQDNVGTTDASELLGRKYLNSKKSIDHFFIDDDAYSIFDKPQIHRVGDKKRFEAPYVLFKKGLDCSNYSFRAVYVEEDFVYKETIGCIKGAKKDKKILLNICGLLNSSVFSYLNLMMNSSVGIEREQDFLSEMKNYPYAYSNELVELVQEIQNTKDKKRRNELQSEINHCVLKMYGLSENYFVDYALSVQIPLLRNRYREQKCNVQMLKAYVDILSRIWDQHFDNSGIYYTFDIYPDIKGKYAAVQMNLSDQDNHGVSF
ncbi:MAG: N-6 DNA methylase, partial [Lachnospiraceae bacterium]|nr:N-6 DNA methylase [Lachnospiraceae bacterium]